MTLQIVVGVVLDAKSVGEGSVVGARKLYEHWKMSCVMAAYFACLRETVTASEEMWARRREGCYVEYRQRGLKRQSLRLELEQSPLYASIMKR